MIWVEDARALLAAGPDLSVPLPSVGAERLVLLGPPPSRFVAPAGLELIAISDAGSEWRAAGLLVAASIPEHVPEDVRLVPSGFHPVVSVGDALSVSQRLPALLLYPDAMLSPGLSASVPSFDLGRGLPAPLARFATKPASALALRGGQILDFGVVRLQARKAKAR
jgi:hypothetical protein